MAPKKTPKVSFLTVPTWFGVWIQIRCSVRASSLAFPACSKSLVEGPSWSSDQPWKPVVKDSLFVMGSSCSFKQATSIEYKTHLKNKTIIELENTINKSTAVGRNPFNPNPIGGPAHDRLVANSGPLAPSRFLHREQTLMSSCMSYDSEPLMDRAYWT